MDCLITSFSVIPGLTRSPVLQPVDGSQITVWDDKMLKLRTGVGSQGLLQVDFCLPLFFCSSTPQLTGHSGPDDCGSEAMFQFGITEWGN